MFIEHIFRRFSSFHKKDNVAFEPYWIYMNMFTHCYKWELNADLKKTLVFLKGYFLLVHFLIEVFIQLIKEIHVSYMM